MDTGRGELGSPHQIGHGNNEPGQWPTATHNVESILITPQPPTHIFIIFTLIITITLFTAHALPSLMTYHLFKTHPLLCHKLLYTILGLQITDHLRQPM